MDVDASDNIYALCLVREDSLDEAWLRKYDAAGAEVWTNGMPYLPSGIALDGDGNIVITGTVDSGTDDIMVAKYDADFMLAWSVSINGPSAGSDNGREITTDADGNVYVAATIARNGEQDNLYSRAFDPDGNDLWGHAYNNADANLAESGRGIAAADDGAVFIPRRRDRARRATQHLDSPAQPALSGMSNGHQETVAATSGTAPAAASTPGRRLRVDVGTSVGRYVVISQIGVGGFGMVFVAYDPELDRRVALKLMHHDVKKTATAGCSARRRRWPGSVTPTWWPSTMSVCTRAVCSSPWSSSPGRPSPTGSPPGRTRGARRFGCFEPRARGWPPPTPRVWCTATSSRTT